MVEQVLPDTPTVTETPGICGTCKRPLPKKREETEAPRVRKTWAVAIPADDQENGADLLDERLEDIRVLLAEQGLVYDDGPKTKYYYLAMALGLFVQHGRAILSDS